MGCTKQHPQCEVVFLKLCDDARLCVTSTQPTLVQSYRFCKSTLLSQAKPQGPIVVPYLVYLLIAIIRHRID